MKKYIVAVLLLAHLTISKAGEREMQNDSILREGKTLYKYEKATWLVSDLAYKSSIKNEIRHSLTYAQNDTIIVIYTDKDKQLIYEGMVNKDGKLIKSGMRFKPLTREERHLLAVRKNAIEQINKMDIVKAPSGGQLNIDIIPHNGGYKLYALSGTLQENIVPFGNDYLFYIDYNGNVISWQKFHNEYNPLTLNQKSQLSIPAASCTKDPYITATDICTFQLYADMYPQLKSFDVETTQGHSFRFDREQNRIMYVKK